jgi:DNA-binding LacI/PurR family transcriptional regulator/spermidine/putrescine-binding protein
LQVRRPKSEDVATRAGVSRTTVSFVLNDRPGASISEATRQRVLAAAAELGYEPHHSARGLAAGRTHTLGLVLRQSTEQVAEDALLAETLRGLATAARAERYRVLVEPYGPENQSYGDLVRSRRTDGLVVSGPRSDDTELVGLGGSAPVVIQGWLPEAGLPSVDVDNVAAARHAVEHLIGLGHRAIGCITNAPLAYTAAAARLEGYREALAAAGIEPEPGWVAEAAFDAASGRREMSGLLARGDLTAVFVASDVVAFGAIAAIREAGLRVPDDVSVVGFDDIPLAAFFDPPLTTIRLPAYELGRAAGAALLDRIHGREVNARTVLPTELVIRSSTAPPRGRRGRSRDRPDSEPVPIRRRHETHSQPSELGRKESDRMSRISRARPTAFLAAVMLVAAACGGSTTTSAPAGGGGGSSQAPAGSGGTGQIGGSVTVWVAWSGAELAPFTAVLKPFQDKTGITVNVETHRETDKDLSTNIAGGAKLPDIAPPPNVQRYEEWASNGTMKPLEDYLDINAYKANTLPGLLIEDKNYGFINGKHYLAMVKSQLKGLIWYNPKVFTGTAPATWDDMLKVDPKQYGADKLFCAAFESGGDSGWPASDDVANIVMRQAGEQTYVDWYNGKVKWTDPKIKQAYQAFGQMVSDQNLYGGSAFALTQNFGNAGKGLFTTPPGCLFMEQATFITNFFIDPKYGGSADKKAGTDYGAFAHPKFSDEFAGNVEGFFDTMVMYNDTPQARALMQYLVSQEAQDLWASQGGSLVANKNVSPDKFPDATLSAAYKILQSSKNVLLTAGDYMPKDMQHAFWKSLLDFTSDQSKLDSLLQNLDQVQQSAYTQ